LGQDPVQAWVFQEEADAIGPEGYSALEGERDCREQLARVPPSAGQPSSTRAATAISAAGSRAVRAGARTSLPAAPGRGQTRFANRSVLCSTSWTAAATTGAGQR
jgi:hypothetical protein